MLTLTTPARLTRPKPGPLRLLAAWRVDKPDAPDPLVVTADHARAGRLRALAKAHRIKLALQPVDPSFVARLDAIAARHQRQHYAGHVALADTKHAAGR